MQKIPTIFERDWDGNRGVIDKFIEVEGHLTATGSNLLPTELKIGTPATEKLDGTNVRLTVRNHILVILEKRRNPSKLDKGRGVEEPWYVDANEFSPEDKWIYDAVKNTDLSDIPDGEWSGEAIGSNIQGNPLGLDKNIVVLFSLGQAPVFENVPVAFNELKEWLPKQQSKYGTGNIEGIVWHLSNGEMFKIKTKDFK